MLHPTRILIYTTEKDINQASHILKETSRKLDKY